MSMVFTGKERRQLYLRPQEVKKFCRKLFNAEEPTFTISSSLSDADIKIILKDSKNQLSLSLEIQKISYPYL